MLLENQLNERNFIEINNSIEKILNERLKSVKDSLFKGDMKIPVHLKKLMQLGELGKTNTNYQRMNFLFDSCIVENMFREYKLKFMNERRKVLV
jgi:hypothetical protein